MKQTPSTSEYDNGTIMMRGKAILCHPTMQCTKHIASNPSKPHKTHCQTLHSWVGYLIHQSWQSCGVLALNESCIHAWIWVSCWWVLMKRWEEYLWGASWNAFIDSLIFNKIYTVYMYIRIHITSRFIMFHHQCYIILRHITYSILQKYSTAHRAKPSIHGIFWNPGVQGDPCLPIKEFHASGWGKNLGSSPHLLHW